MRRERWVAAAVSVPMAVAGVVAAAGTPALAGGPGIITTVAGGPGRGPGLERDAGPAVGGHRPGRHRLHHRRFQRRACVHQLRHLGERGGRSGGTPGPAVTAVRPPGRILAASVPWQSTPPETGHRRCWRLSDPGGGRCHGHLLRAGDDRRGHLHHRRGRHRGFAGDGGPATTAELGNPKGMAVDAAGNVLIANTATAGSGWWRPDRDLLRPGDDRRGHLHHRRGRHRGGCRGRRPGQRRRTRLPAG